MLLTLRSLKKSLGIGGTVHLTVSPLLSAAAFRRIQQRVDHVYDQTKKLEQGIAIYHEDTSQLALRAAVYGALDNMGVNIELLEKLRTLTFFIGTVRESMGLKQKLGSVLSEFELKQATVMGGKLAVLFVARHESAAARGLLDEAGFTPLPLQDYSVRDKKSISSTLRDAKKKEEKMNKERLALRQELKDFILEQEAVLEEEIKKAELPLRFATTAQSLIAQGYVPESVVAQMREALTRATVESVFIEDEEPEHDEAVPVKLQNKKSVGNFEVLTRLYELPAYLEVDPTVLFFLTFPLFFGIMMGDVGYGLVSLGLFAWVKKKMPSGKQLLNVFIFAAVVSIFFGLLFGEYFGFEHFGKDTGKALCENAGVCLHPEVVELHGEKEIIFPFPHLLSRMESKVTVFGYELFTVLFLGVIIGVIHLNFGLLIGFYNVLHAHGLKHAVLEKLSWFILEGGVVLMVLSFTGTVPLHWSVGLAIFFAAAVMIAIGEGIKGIIEIPALFSNMLSYMRLGAVGLAGVALAVVINENLAQPFFEKGGIFIVFGLVIMAVGHTINICLCIIGPFLHGVRLHYVEFFSKFFHGGGFDYVPFGYKKRTPSGR